MSTTRHLLTLADCSVPDIVRLVNGAQAWKRAVRGGTSAATQTITSSVSALPSTSSALLARGKTLGLLFSKRSTRTRLAGETGFAYRMSTAVATNDARGLHFSTLNSWAHSQLADMPSSLAAMTSSWA